MLGSEVKMFTSFTLWTGKHTFLVCLAHHNENEKLVHLSGSFNIGEYINYMFYMS